MLAKGIKTRFVRFEKWLLFLLETQMLAKGIKTKRLYSLFQSFG